MLYQFNLLAIPDPLGLVEGAAMGLYISPNCRHPFAVATQAIYQKLTDIVVALQNLRLTNSKLLE
jgi:hypothetical protein